MPLLHTRLAVLPLPPTFIKLLFLTSGAVVPPVEAPPLLLIPPEVQAVKYKIDILVPTVLKELFVTDGNFSLNKYKNCSLQGYTLNTVP
jgi:hypothetical protein